MIPCKGLDSAWMHRRDQIKMEVESLKQLVTHNPTGRSLSPYSKVLMLDIPQPSGAQCAKRIK